MEIMLRGANLDPEETMKELILYVSHACRSDPAFGLVKLHKILFFSDFLAFQRLGEPITGLEYFRKPNGPMLKRFLPIREQLEQTKEARVEERPYHTYTQERLVPLRSASLDHYLSRAEVDVVDEVIARLRGMNATQLSDYSHKHPGWVLTEPDAVIDYATQLLPHPDDPPPVLTEAEHRFIAQVIERHGVA